jgi:hypothetical protein
MKKLFGVFGVVLILVGSTLIIPAVGMGVDEKYINNLEIKWKILFVIGRVNYNLGAKLITGYAVLGYVGGEILTFSSIYIKFELFPLFINNGVFSSFCIYKPADILILKL